MNNDFYAALVVGIIFSAPIYRWFANLIVARQETTRGSSLLSRSIASAADLCFLGFVFIYSIASLMGGAYNPFLYFRF